MQALAADPALSHIPVVVITGAGVAMEQRRSEITGEIIRKPFDLPVLLSVVRRHCRAA
jgi:CheY-like chemotaxis protein